MLPGRGFEMAPSQKRTLLIVLTLVSLAIIMLAGSLPRLELQSGLPFPGADLEEGAGPDDPAQSQGAIPRTGIIPSLLQGVLAAGFWLVLGYLAILALKQAGIRRLVLLAGLALGILGVLQILPSYQPSGPTVGSEEAFSEEAAPIFEYATSPLGTPPPWLIGLVIGGMGVVSGVLLFLLFRQRAGSPTEADPVAQAADTALQDLRSGMDLENVIVACYARMSQALQEEQGIERGAAMTAREFEGVLAQRGVPHEPVRQLTRLFEAARYGHLAAQQIDERAAVDCLTAIRGYKGVLPEKDGDRA